jgi:hypothetical protein
LFFARRRQHATYRWEWERTASLLFSKLTTFGKHGTDRLSNASRDSTLHHSSVLLLVASQTITVSSAAARHNHSMWPTRVLRGFRFKPPVFPPAKTNADVQRAIGLSKSAWGEFNVPLLTPSAELGPLVTAW